MLGEELSFDNILSQEEAENLFSVEEESTEETSQEEKKDNKEENEQTIEVTPDNLFDASESVDSNDEDESQEQGGATSSTSPKASTYSSIAKAMKDDGLLSDLDDLDPETIKTPEEFEELLEKIAESKLDAKQKRINEALEYGMEPDEIKQYENTINYLENIDEKALKDESEQGERLRMQLIYQDFLNNGASPEKAKKLMEASIKAGDDIQDAIEALESNRKYYKAGYDKVLLDAKAEYEKEINTRKSKAEQLRKDILEKDEPFEGVKLNKNVREKVFDTLTKPVFKDEQGNMYTAIQKAEKDNPVDFMKKLGVVYYLTDGFKNINGLAGIQAKKETKKAIRNLESIINNTSRGTEGNLQFMSGVGGEEDPEAYAGLHLDI